LEWERGVGRVTTNCTMQQKNNKKLVMSGMLFGIPEHPRNAEGIS